MIRTVDFSKVYNPFQHQRDVNKSNKLIAALMAGYGAGKSLMLAAEAIRLSQINSGLPGCFYGPTYDEVVNKVGLPLIEEMLKGVDVEYTYNAQKKRLTIPLWNGIIWFASAHNYKSLKGPTLAWAVLDEPGLYPEDAWYIILSRVREKRAKRLAIRMGGTPEGMNWVYDVLVTDADNDVYLRYASTLDNPALPKHVVKAMYKRFPKRLAKMYLEGQFIPLAELQVYYPFDDKKHLDKTLEFDKKLPINLGIDFNVANMHCIVDQEKNDVLRVLTDITAYDTPELAENMITDLQQYPEWHLYPDATGNSRSSKGISDFEILRRRLNQSSINYVMHYPAANGSVRDRVNAVNTMFEDAEGDSHVKIHPRVKSLRKDFQQVSYLKNSREIDKRSNIDLTHASDAWGYRVVRTHPVRPAWRV